jgi:hypothetical protein
MKFLSKGINDMFKFNKIAQFVTASSLMLSSMAFADTFEVTIINTTAGQVITPPLIITHNSNVSLFSVGQAAPEFLVPLVEDGDTSGFSGAQEHEDILAVTLSEAPVVPGSSLTFTIESSQEFPLISIAGMFASSNDAFISLNAQNLTFDNDTHTYYANVYDAGTEFNSEDCAYIPGPPCANGGVRDIENAEGFVTIHSGIHGISDLSPSSLGWSNPGAIIKIKHMQ